MGKEKGKEKEGKEKRKGRKKRKDSEAFGLGWGPRFYVSHKLLVTPLPLMHRLHGVARLSITGLLNSGSN